MIGNAGAINASAMIGNAGAIAGCRVTSNVHRPYHLTSGLSLIRSGIASLSLSLAFDQRSISALSAARGPLTRGPSGSLSARVCRPNRQQRRPTRNLRGSSSPAAGPCASAQSEPPERPLLFRSPASESVAVQELYRPGPNRRLGICGTRGPSAALRSQVSYRARTNLKCHVTIHLPVRGNLAQIYHLPGQPARRAGAYG
jgi:hypothetical protein